jgi:TonB family protein
VRHTWFPWMFAAGALCVAQLAVSQHVELSQAERSQRHAIYQTLIADVTKPLVDGDDSSLVGRFVPPESPRPPSDDYYPEQLRREGVQGEVVLVYVLEITGRVSTWTILRPSMDRRLDAAAVGALKHEAFTRPALLDGKPVRAFITYRVSFKLIGKLIGDCGQMPNKSLERCRAR